MTPEDAEKIQNEIYRKMPAGKKIKIAGQLFLFGKKLGALRKRKIYGPRKASLQNSKNLRET